MSSRWATGLACTLIVVAGCSSAPVRHPPAAVTHHAPGPVIDQDFPDPDVLRVGGTYYAYATQPTGGGRNLQMATSTDLRKWTVATADPLPRLPAWAISGRTWAPDVSAVAAGAGGGYVMYFAAHSASPDVQCIGVARGRSPAGPFTPVEKAPLVCPAADGGAIDPASYVEPGGRRYLLWKNDGNCCGKDTWLYLQPVSPDGVRLTGPPQRLIKQDQPWEGHLIEAPVLIRHGAEYVLFYSANDYSGADYATGYATSARLTGPYRKAAGPLLTSAGSKVIGPGGEDAFTDPSGRTHIAFHGWDETISYRGMYVADLNWRGGVPVVAG